MKLSSHSNTSSAQIRFDEIIDKLDLTEHIEKLCELFSRPKPLALNGDIKLHLSRIEQLSECDVALPPQIAPCAGYIVHLSKQGLLHLSECAEFFKICEYFNYLKKQATNPSLCEYLNKIKPPEALEGFFKYFKNGEFDEGCDERFAAISANIKIATEAIKSKLSALIKAHSNYLLDTQLHLVANKECLLLRAGYSKVIAGTVMARSLKGGFYVLADCVKSEYGKIDEYNKAKEQLLYEYAKLISAQLSKHIGFLKFIDKEFDLIDAYVARAAFARLNDLQFFYPASEFCLREFSHPALKDPKPISADFTKSVLIITGVNAGGKSMLLKSILAASFMCKYLVPFRAHKSSKIATFKEYHAIVADPQNSANNISTFAGRMRGFSEIFGRKNYILGIDEIELGTDFEEAAMLFYEIINKLQEDGKIIITTHHKRLAMLLANKPYVQLLAALYDEHKERPKYEFLEGIIGKSYAFETALRYGIPYGIIALANEHFSEHEKSLNEMLNKNLELDAKLKMQLSKVQAQKEQIAKRLEQLKLMQTEAKEQLKASKLKLEKEYLHAISEAKKTLDFKELKDKQRQINAAHDAYLRANKANAKPTEAKILKVGDRVKYENIKAVILAINKNQVSIEANGIKMRVSKEALERFNAAVFEHKPSVTISASKPISAGVKLDLHGLRVEEALEKTDKFISDALIAGFNEVLIYHGIGTGVLAKAVKEFLSKHPKVAEFCDAPPKQGGFGAKIVRF